MIAWRVGIAAALLCVAACGSDEKPDSADVAAGSNDEGATAGRKVTYASDGPGPWIKYASAPTKPAFAFNHAFALPPPAPAVDPDVAIERYAKECAGGAKNETCRSLKREVEGAFLEALLAVRAGDEKVDPEWYRAAAVADMPQLACVGVNELAYLPGRTAQDEALIAKALDHPAPSVRLAALAVGQKIPAIADVAIRSAGNVRGASGTCLDGAVDDVPGSKWVGGYPGARYRAFASDSRRRWFTTSDPLDKVAGWFASAGKPARTQEQMAADAMARFTQQMNEISASPDPDDEARLTEVMHQMAGGGQASWNTQAFQGMEGVGEVKYVMLTDTQPLAIFEDDVFKGTSLVALRPNAKVEFPPDVEKATREAAARYILGY